MKYCEEDEQWNCNEKPNGSLSMRVKLLKNALDELFCVFKSFKQRMLVNFNYSWCQSNFSLSMPKNI